MLLGPVQPVPRTSRRGLRWLPGYVRDVARRRSPRAGETVHALICIADHFEPANGGVPPEVAAARVERWATEYPRRFGSFCDADGRPPQHTFFYPLEMYRASEVARLADLCRAGFGEVEVHLHHRDDTAENLRSTLRNYARLLRERHGLLAQCKRTGATRYAFVHGNWALANSLPGGRACGVNDEIDVLRETGCYADFTLPSYPSPAQTRKINSIYRARGDAHAPRSHDRGIDAGSGPAPADALLLIQGPLLLNWRSRKYGLLPRVENADLRGNQPPTERRLDLWLKARVQVVGRPDWFFVKLHTHGASERNERVLLGEPMVRFHEALASRARRDPRFHFHYVTAREMYNLVRTAEDGWTGTVGAARDYELEWPAPAPAPRPAAARETVTAACETGGRS